MKNNEKVVLGLACFFGGVALGFLIAPIKKGIYCGNNNDCYFRNDKKCCGENEEKSEEI